VSSGNKNESSKRTIPSALIDDEVEFFWQQFLPEGLKARFRGGHYVRKVADSVVWLFMEHALRILIGLVVTVWMARYLGPVQFGQYNFALALATIFGAISAAALDNIVMRELVHEPTAKNDILGTATFLKGVSGIFGTGLCIGTIIVLRPDDAVMIALVTVIASAFIFRALNTIALWFQSQIKTRYVVWVRNTALVVMAFVRIWLIVIEAPLISFGVATLIEAVITAIGLVVIYVIRGERMGFWSVNLNRARKIIVASWPLLISTISATLYLRLDVVMLAELYNEAAAGLYGAATKISEAWYIIPMALASTLQPWIMEGKTHGEEVLRRRLRKIYGLMSASSVTIAIVVSLISAPLVSVIFGNAYQGAGIVLAVHVWAAVAVFLGVASSQYLIAEKLQIIVMYRTTLGLLCNVVLNLVLIPDYGAVGAAIATLVSYSISVFAIILFTRSRDQGMAMLRSLDPREWWYLWRKEQSAV
jgi:PST family polysaccharide transporter